MLPPFYICTSAAFDFCLKHWPDQCQGTGFEKPSCCSLHQYSFSYSCHCCLQSIMRCRRESLGATWCCSWPVCSFMHGASLCLSSSCCCRLLSIMHSACALAVASRRGSVARDMLSRLWFSTLTALRLQVSQLHRRFRQPAARHALGDTAHSFAGRHIVFHLPVAFLRH